MDKYKITVTAASGVEGVVKKELRSLGFPDTKAIDGGIEVCGSFTDVARLNMFLGCADRVYLALGSFPAASFDELFDGVKVLPFGELLPFNAKIIVNGKCRKSKLFAVSACQSVVKKAILQSLSAKYRRKLFPENGEVYGIEFVISDNVATVYLNTSGEGLHKRGWRDLVWEAPIKETLACALLNLSDFSCDMPFCDPFCGSGTIVIEAARMALGIAPGKNRRFAYQNWDFFDENAYRLAVEEAKDNEHPERKLNFFGSDINPKAISLATRHAQRAGIKDKIHLQVQNALDLHSPEKNGCLVTNPPYGERLLSATEVQKLYREFGKVWHSLDNWSLHVITAANGFEKCLGQKSDKNRKLYNSGIECKFYSFYRKDAPRT